MLPIVLPIVEFRQQRNMDYIKKRVAEHSPIMAKIRTQIQFEGRAAVIQRPDESPENTKIHQAVSEIKILKVPMNLFNGVDVDIALDNAAKQFAQQFELTIAKTMNEVTSRTGNVVNSNNGMATAENLLELFEKMQHNFSQSGEWIPPTLWASPQIISLHASTMADPSFRSELKKILDKKFHEYRNREANRSLAG